MDEQLTQLSNETATYLVRLAISIGIGFLIGMERTFTKLQNKEEEEFAGLRTHTLIAIFGFLSALVSQLTGLWFLGVAFAGMMAFVIISYIRLSTGNGNAGGTSEVATILTFLLGALVFFGHILLALVVVVVVLLLLTYKPSLHLFVQKLSLEEMRAIIQFVIISALVIPFLPDSNFGPYDLWNLKDIWKMVILVSGTSLIGYLVAKLVGNKGTMLAGMVGGLVSSTAVTLTFSRRSKQGKIQDTGQTGSFYFAMAIISACTIMFPRILFEVFIVNRNLAQQLWLPILAITLAGFGGAYYIYKKRQGKKEETSLPLKNPLNFATAIKFAIFFAGVMLLVKYSSENFGDSGTYIAGALSGITDVDAITLSMAKMATSSENYPIAINTILLAALSNTFVKFCIVMVLGSRQLLRTAAIGFVAIFATGLSFFLYYLLF
ncbi:MgtC/SapB family protein [Flavisolibacter sp. BT320]|nr:MgtC/SapB family protein [Flavisolibacter longurius]